MNASREANAVSAMADALQNVVKAAKSAGIALPRPLLGKIRSSCEAARETSVFARKPLNIAVAGRFSSGKSRFINSLVGEDIAKVGLEPMTRCKTTFTGGTGEKRLRIVDNCTGNEVANLEEYRERSSKKSDSPNEFTVYLPDPAWQGVELVDTPGFNSSDSGKVGDGKATDQSISIAAAATADIVFFVFAIQDGCIPDDSMRYLDKISKSGVGLYLVANMADRRSPEERRDILERIREALARRDIHPRNIFSYCSLTAGGGTTRVSSRLLEMASGMRQNVLDGIRNLVLRKDTILAERHRAGLKEVAERIETVAEEAFRCIDKQIRQRTDLLEQASGEVQQLAGRVVGTLSPTVKDAVKRVRFGKEKLVGSRAWCIPDDWVAYLPPPQSEEIFSPDAEKSLRLEIRAAFSETSHSEAFQGFEREQDIVRICRQCVTSLISNCSIHPFGIRNQEERNAFFVECGKRDRDFCRICDNEGEADNTIRNMKKELGRRFRMSFRDMCLPRIVETLNGIWATYRRTTQNVCKTVTSSMECFRQSVRETGKAIGDGKQDCCRRQHTERLVKVIRKPAERLVKVVRQAGAGTKKKIRTRKSKGAKPCP
jgi:GTP-binding protein EngB required for normal cell division